MRPKKAVVVRPKKVVNVTRSPLNLARWHVTLSCGHEQWVTSQRMPRAVKCDVCGTTKGKAR